MLILFLLLLFTSTACHATSIHPAAVRAAGPAQLIVLHPCHHIFTAQSLRQRGIEVSKNCPVCDVLVTQRKPIIATLRQVPPPQLPPQKSTPVAAPQQETMGSCSSVSGPRAELIEYHENIGLFCLCETVKIIGCSLTCPCIVCLGCVECKCGLCPMMEDNRLFWWNHSTDPAFYYCCRAYPCCEDDPKDPVLCCPVLKE